MKCPLCGSHVAYVGAQELECYGPAHGDKACPNARKPEPLSDEDQKKLSQMVIDLAIWPGLC